MGRRRFRGRGGRAIDWGREWERRHGRRRDVLALIDLPSTVKEKSMEREVPTPIPGDDSAGFDDLERTFVRRFVPDFDWLIFDQASSRRPLPVPLNRARVGLVATAGAHLPEQEPMSPTGEIQLIPVTEAGRLQLSHIGYDTVRASKDPDVVVPVRGLQRLAADGFIGSLAPTVVSGMGFVPRGADVLERSVPVALEALEADDVDLAVLVPA
jgi:D-proline reductase (dithiol) PrdB